MLERIKNRRGDSWWSAALTKEEHIVDPRAAENPSEKDTTDHMGSWRFEMIVQRLHPDFESKHLLPGAGRAEIYSKSTSVIHVASFQNWSSLQIEFYYNGILIKTAYGWNETQKASFNSKEFQIRLMGQIPWFKDELGFHSDDGIRQISSAMYPAQ